MTRSSCGGPCGACRPVTAHEVNIEAPRPPGPAPRRFGSGRREAGPGPGGRRRRRPAGPAVQGVHRVVQGDHVDILISHGVPGASFKAFKMSKRTGVAVSTRAATRRRAVPPGPYPPGHEHAEVAEDSASPDARGSAARN